MGSWAVGAHVLMFLKCMGIRREETCAVQDVGGGGGQVGVRKINLPVQRAHSVVR